MSGALYPSSRHDRPHARLYDHHLNHAAWRSLSGNALKLLLYLMASYRPNKPNSFPVGRKTLADKINVSEKTAAKLVDELVEKGHLREERKGRNRGFTKTRERVASLTRYDTEMHAGNPELPIEVWNAKRAGEKVPVKPGKNSGSVQRTSDGTGNDGRAGGATIH